MVNKKVVIIMTIISICIVGIIIGISVKSFGKAEYTFNEVSIEENKNTTKNTVDIKEKENVVSENVNTENTTVENSGDKEKTDENKEKSGKDLAFDLAKKEWGEDEDVYFYLEEQLSDSVYIVSVRDKNTTKGILDYEINIKTKEVSEY